MRKGNFEILLFSFLISSLLFSLGSSRFLKTIVCRYDKSRILLKIFTKPDTYIQLQAYVQQLECNLGFFLKT
jgi:hypothetical protein